MKYYPNFSDVFDDLFDSGVNTTKANTMLCDIRETENTYEMNIACLLYTSPSPRD